MSETQRIADELYWMLIHQHDGCQCSICMNIFLLRYEGMLDEMMNDMKCVKAKKGEEDE